MTDAAFFWIMGAATTIAIFGIGWAKAELRLADAKRIRKQWANAWADDLAQLDASEAERIRLRAFHDRVMAARNVPLIDGAAAALAAELDTDLEAL